MCRHSRLAMTHFEIIFIYLFIYLHIDFVSFLAYILVRQGIDMKSSGFFLQAVGVD